MSKPTEIKLTIIHHNKPEPKFSGAKYIFGFVPASVAGVLGMVALGVDPQTAALSFAGFAVLVGLAWLVIAAGLSLMMGAVWSKEVALIEAANENLRLMGEKG